MLQRCGHDQGKRTNSASRTRNPARAGAEGAVAGELDHSSRQSRARECRRAQGRRTSGFIGLARHHHDGALFSRAAPAGPRGGEAACEPELSRHPVSARKTEPAEARELSRLQGRAELSLAHQGCRRRRFLDRLGRPRRRADTVLQPGAGLRARPWLGLAARPEGRMVALWGTPSSTKATSSKRILEGWKQGLRNCWWIIDYNRQSLDAVIREGLWARTRRCLPPSAGRCRILKYGSLLRAAFAEPGGEALRAWIDACPNQLYSALVFHGGAAWRKRLTRRDRRSGRGLAADRSARATTSWRGS